MSITPKIKICGLTNFTDANLACELGADYLGFIFTAKSPRFLTKNDFMKFSQLLPKNIKKVGVFINSKQEEILEFLELGIEIVQLHGNETPEFAENLQKKCEVWKAITVSNQNDLEQNKEFSVDCFLIDNKNGGSGEICNWDLAEKFARQKPVFLAGGISTENLLEAWEKVHPIGFDLSSSLEEFPGKKSLQKMQSFFQKKSKI